MRERHRCGSAGQVPLGAHGVHDPGRESYPPTGASSTAPLSRPCTVSTKPAEMPSPPLAPCRVPLLWDSAVQRGKCSETGPVWPGRRQERRDAVLFGVGCGMPRSAKNRFRPRVPAWCDPSQPAHDARRANTALRREPWSQSRPALAGAPASVRRHPLAPGAWRRRLAAARAPTILATRRDDRPVPSHSRRSPAILPRSDCPCPHPPSTIRSPSSTRAT